MKESLSLKIQKLQKGVDIEIDRVNIDNLICLDEAMYKQLTAKSSLVNASDATLVVNEDLEQTEYASAVSLAQKGSLSREEHDLQTTLVHQEGQGTKRTELAVINELKNAEAPRLDEKEWNEQSISEIGVASEKRIGKNLAGSNKGPNNKKTTIAENDKKKKVTIEVTDKDHIKQPEQPSQANENIFDQISRHLNTSTKFKGKFMMKNNTNQFYQAIKLKNNRNIKIEDCNQQNLEMPPIRNLIANTHDHQNVKLQEYENKLKSGGFHQGTTTRRKSLTNKHISNQTPIPISSPFSISIQHQSPPSKTQKSGLEKKRLKYQKGQKNDKKGLGNELRPNLKDINKMLVIENKTGSNKSYQNTQIRNLIIKSKQKLNMKSPFEKRQGSVQLHSVVPEIILPRPKKSTKTPMARSPASSKQAYSPTFRSRGKIGSQVSALSIFSPTSTLLPNINFRAQSSLEGNQNAVVQGNKVHQGQQKRERKASAKEKVYNFDEGKQKHQFQKQSRSQMTNYQTMRQPQRNLNVDSNKLSHAVVEEEIVLLAHPKPILNSTWQIDNTPSKFMKNSILAERFQKQKYMKIENQESECEDNSEAESQTKLANQPSDIAQMSDGFAISVESKGDQLEKGFSILTGPNMTRNETRIQSREESIQSKKLDIDTIMKAVQQPELQISGQKKTDLEMEMEETKTQFLDELKPSQKSTRQNGQSKSPNRTPIIKSSPKNKNNDNINQSRKTHQPNNKVHDKVDFHQIGKLMTKHQQEQPGKTPKNNQSTAQMELQHHYTKINIQRERNSLSFLSRMSVIPMIIDQHKQNQQINIQDHVFAGDREKAVQKSEWKQLQRGVKF